MASLQEELAAAKLREAEANLALKDLKAKVAELSSMWKKHLQQRAEADSEASASSAGSSMAVPSTPKKLLGSFLEGKSEVARLEEELMTARLIEVESEAELKASRLKVMELETQVGKLFQRIMIEVTKFFYVEPSDCQSTEKTRRGNEPTAGISGDQEHQ